VQKVAKAEFWAISQPLHFSPFDDSVLARATKLKHFLKLYEIQWAQKAQIWV